MPTAMRSSVFVRGQLVEVRSPVEIAATLDSKGTFEGMPFMPEMVKYCGRRFRIYRRSDKTCVEGHGLRRMTSTVFLENIRCDGAAHDGCQRGCLIFWKEAWLKPSDDSIKFELTRDMSIGQQLGALGDLQTRAGPHYYCQSTQLASATGQLSRWNVSHFLDEWRNGELTLGLLVRIVTRTLLNRARGAFGLSEIGVPSGERGKKPKGDLKLITGEWIVVKSPEEIRATLDPRGRNNGLSFEPDMIEFTTGTYRVSRPVRKIIHEETGRMVELTSTVALEGVTCRGVCAKNCPRNNPIFWRESWLRRSERASVTQQTNTPQG